MHSFPLMDMSRLAGQRLIFALALALLSLPAGSQQQTTQQPGVPDAPSATRPPQPLPNPEPPPASAPNSPSNSAPPDNGQNSNSRPPANAPAAGPLDVKRAPAGASPSADPDSRGQFTLPVQVNLVVVPVTVKDSDGRLVAGLLKRDFSILENGVQQPIKLFTSDPFPLSVAIVMDSNLPDQTLSKVRNTLPALAGAFSQFDEVSLLTYANTVNRRLNFGDTSENLTAALRRSQPKGRLGGPPVYSGPMTGGPTPSVNGRPLDPATPSIPVIRHESSVLNDAILEAARVLGQRDRSRRKVIFVISDGREDGSNASYSDVLKVLLSNNISVYALAVDAAAIPGYNTVEKMRIPRMGYGNILPKYVSATGGEVFAEFTQDAIESSYARITEQARNQYTLGYSARSTAAGDYRSIEVLVHRPGLYVHAKDGYYPLPPGRPALPE